MPARRAILTLSLPHPFIEVTNVSGYISLLRRHPDFARLWLASVISLMGDWFNFIALSALVSRYSDGSGLAVSGLLLARYLPPLFISPVAGVLADRLNRKALLVFSDLARAVIVLLLLTANTPDLLWLIYLLTVLQACMSAMFEPARGAILPALVGQEDILKANTLNNVTWSAMLAVGALLGGVVTTLLGTAAVLVIDSLTFLLSALFILGIRTNTKAVKPAASAAAEAKSAGSFMDGLRYVRSNPVAAAALFIKFGLSLGSVDTLMIAYGTILFVINNDSTLPLGILYSAFGVGAVIGPLLVNRYNDGKILTMRRMVIGSFACVTLGWLLFGFAPSLLLASVGLAVRAAGGSVTWTYGSTIIQLSTENHYLGRVFSFDWAGYYLAITFSTLITGILIDTLGSAHIRSITVGTGLMSIIPLLIWVATVLWLERRETLPRAASTQPVP